MTLKARVVLLVAGIWALAFSVTRTLARDLTEWISADFSAEVVNLAADMDRDFRLHIDVLNRLAATLEPKILADPAKLDHALDKFTDTSVIVPDSCFAANSDGVVIAGYPEDKVTLRASIADQDYFRQVMASGRPVVGAPVRGGKGQPQPAVPIAVPLRNGAGATVGALVGSILLTDPSFRQLEGAKVGRNGWFLVVSPTDRVIVAATNRSRILTTLPGHGAIPLLDRRLEAGFEGPGITVASIGTEIFSVSRKMETTGWVVIASNPTAEVFAPIKGVKRQIYLAALFISLAVAVVLWFALTRQFAPLAQAGSAMQRMAKGEIPLASIPVTRADEIGTLIGSFNQLVAERRQAEHTREQLTRQLELLSERLATAQEEERRKIAHELHEELGQELSALKFYIDMMGPGSGEAGMKTPSEHALAVTLHATARVRKLALDLSPPELEDFGLPAALPTYCERLALAGGWNLHLDAPHTDVRAPRPVERACFRVLQEVLSNVLRHANATEVWIQLHQGADKLELAIRDNGIGFDRKAISEETRPAGGNLGLFGMQMRAKQVGGSVQINSAVGAGTEIRAVFPLSVSAVENRAQESFRC